MSNDINTRFLEDKYEEGLGEGMSEEEAGAWAHKQMLEHQEQQEEEDAD
jgi:hypothetical protein